MQSKIIHILLVHRNGLEMNKGISIVNAKGAISGCRDEVAREVEISRGVKGESSDSGGMVMKRTKGRGGSEVVEVDGVVGSARSDNRAGDSNSLDEREMGRVGKERGKS